MSRIVDSRSEFIDQEPPVIPLKHYHPDHAHVVESGEHGRSDPFGFGDDPRTCRGRRAGAAKNAVLVMTFGERIDRDLAIPAAGGNQRHLASEIGRRLGDRRPVSKACKRRFSLLHPLHPDLALAVIAAAASLQQEWRAQVPERLTQRRQIVDRPEGDGVDPRAIQEGFLVDPVLGHRQGPGVWRGFGSQFSEGFQRPGRNVLELERDYLGVSRKRGERLAVIVGRDDSPSGDT